MPTSSKVDEDKRNLENYESSREGNTCTVRGLGLWKDADNRYCE
jgi:hypothetical protein